MTSRGLRGVIALAGVLTCAGVWELSPGASRSGTFAESPGAGSGSPRLSWFSLRSTLRQAREAKDLGRHEEALRLYETVLEGTSVEQAKRAEALYWIGMLRLSTDRKLRDLERAREALKELKSRYPEWERLDEAGLALALAEDVATTHSSSETLLAEAAREAETCRTEKEDLSRRAAAAEEEVKTLKTDVESLRAEATGLREDVKRKDAALRKVREVMVGWKPSR